MNAPVPQCQPMAEPMRQHTPTPWAADPDWCEGYSWNIHIVDAANPDMRICFMTSDGPAQENAALIVEAVNNHASLKAGNEQLRKALEELTELLEFWMHESRLQTFEDRQRFRKAARTALSPSTPEVTG